ncbi:MAG TPA: hypothetical protein VHO50_02280 [Bacteroidales bacterium]|nr:hypothetical protein [Bacteroidales bacterium]
MDKELMIKKLEDEVFVLQTRNRILKAYLHILVSSPMSIPAERIRFVKGDCGLNFLYNLN